ncbi:hypothetical protein H0H92_012649 [Tricholoma furcatifolium]|nr:hypothetical protein H0H92_012649 [Tricholoma furcatifolium]
MVMRSDNVNHPDSSPWTIDKATVAHDYLTCARWLVYDPFPIQDCHSQPFSLSHDSFLRPSTSLKMVMRSDDVNHPDSSPWTIDKATVAHDYLTCARWLVYDPFPIQDCHSQPFSLSHDSFIRPSTSLEMVMRSNDVNHADCHPGPFALCRMVGRGVDLDLFVGGPVDGQLKNIIFNHLSYSK